MKKQILLIATLAALAATSCSKRDTGGPATEPGQIKVTSTIAGVESKALVGSNAAVLTDAAFVHAQVASAANPVSFAGVTAIAGDRAATGDITFTPAPMYDKQGNISYLMGYHPAVVATNNVVTWTPDGATDILVTNLWNAGTYTSPTTTGMEFAHILARIEVKTVFAAGSSSGAVADTWGQLKGIAFKDAPKTITFDYTTNAVASATAAADLANFSLLNGVTYTVGAFTPVTITASTNAVAAAMIPPTGVNAFTLIVTTEKQADVEIPVTLDAGVFAPGQIHVVTLAFDARNKAIKATATTIADWGTGGSGDGNATPPPPVILESGVLPYNKTGEVGPDTAHASYNGLYGENTGSDPLTYTNGKYYTTKALAYTGEPPYYKFEIAREEAYNGTDNNKAWRALQGTAANHGDNICVQKHGDGWRLPRISELRLMYENRVELNKAVEFTDLAASYYWSATEFNTSNAWAVYFSTGGTDGSGKALAYSKARCVREL